MCTTASPWRTTRRLRPTRLSLSLSRSAWPHGSTAWWSTRRPRIPLRPPARPAEPELFLHLEWFRAIDEHSADFAAHYAAAAEEFFPRALPRAFGHWSPTVKYAKEGAAGFDRFYREECATDRVRIAGRKSLEYGYLEEWSPQQIGERQRLGLVLDATTLVKPRPHLADGELRESAPGLLHLSRASPAPGPSEDREPWLPEDFLPLLDDPEDPRLATATARAMPDRLRSSNRLVRTR